MASSSSAPANPLLGHVVSEKLTKGNHAIWKAQIKAAVRGARLLGHLTGDTKAPEADLTIKSGDGKDNKDEKVVNPAYEAWEAADQQVLSFILSALSKDVLIQVATSNTAHQASQVIEDMFASQTRARAINLRLALSTSHKGSMSCTEYFAKIKALGDRRDGGGSKTARR